MRSLSSFSAALCRGLIEASLGSRASADSVACFPRLYAAASLKRSARETIVDATAKRFPRLYAAASLKLRHAPGLELAIHRFPRLYAAASLKLVLEGIGLAHDGERFPRLYAAASLKQACRPRPGRRPGLFSAALCRGLIEAGPPTGPSCAALGRFPRLYAAASLKPPAALADDGPLEGFPRLYAAASLKRGDVSISPAELSSFPRLYAAASLKPLLQWEIAWPFPTFSAALCRGLIEASRAPGWRSPTTRRFSAALCRGLIEAIQQRYRHDPDRSFSAALCRGLIEAP